VLGGDGLLGKDDILPLAGRQKGATLRGVGVYAYLVMVSNAPSLQDKRVWDGCSAMHSARH
jgi:hypothetical protein